MTGTGWIARIVSQFGVACKDALAHGQDEAGIRRAVEDLLLAAADEIGLEVYLHAETPVREYRIRPDLAARVGSLRRNIVGYVELKGPRKADITPGGLSGRDRKQWEGMSKLPNLIYTNGRTWILYRFGQQKGKTIYFEGDLYRSGSRLRVLAGLEDAFEALLRAFFIWQPQPLTTMREVVASIAPLCRFLREQVEDRLAAEAMASRGRRPFTRLARALERSVFPSTDEREENSAFADRYAQTVTFALLLAGSEDIPLSGQSLHEVGRKLSIEHSVMGRTLQLLTDHVEEPFRDSLDMIVRVADAVDWVSVRTREPGVHVYLYEHFLQEYDPDLRRASGTYYTPASLVQEMIRLVDEVLIDKLHCPDGFADPAVAIIDPAMGTGTFLSAIVELVAERRSSDGNLGFRAEAVEELARRLMGFERQMGAFAVAQMRIAQTLRGLNARLRLPDMRLHVTDTLADPWQPSTLFDDPGSSFDPLREDAEAASLIKREERITVVIGNPPTRERARGEGGWIEERGEGQGPSPLDDFRLGGEFARFENKLKNLYVYFWRWATHKVFELHDDHQHGVVCFLSAAGFIRGPGFSGMRAYLRRTCSEGWIVDLTPERKRPPQNSRFFPGVQQEMAVALFVRREDADPHASAPVHYAAVTGTREEKQLQLSRLKIGGPEWRITHADPLAPFTPATTSDWEGFPALDALLPWYSPGVTPNRTWVVHPDPKVLNTRWDRLVREPDPQAKASLLKTTRDRTLTSDPAPFPGMDRSSALLDAEHGPCPVPIQIARRAFDRQWLIPDSRVVDFPRRPLWRAAQQEGQVFLVEQHRQPITSGPALLFSSAVPDVHYFNGNGGRVLPMKHSDGTANTAPGLLEHLANSYGLQRISVEDLIAYIAGITGHPSFTDHFSDELNTPGVHIPLTADREIWEEAARLGRHVIWASTFGRRCADATDGRPPGRRGLWQQAHPEIRYTSEVDPRSLPADHSHDPQSGLLRVGAGVFTGVTERMRSYEVGGRNVLDSWLTARSAHPRGRIGSPLDRVHSEHWLPEWSNELVEILSALAHLTAIESEQGILLERALSRPLIDVAELTRRHILAPPLRARAPRPTTDDAVLPTLENLDSQERPPVQPLLPSPPPLPDSAASRQRQRSPRRRTPRHDPER